VRLFRELGHENFTLHATRTFAWTYHELGDLEQARALHEENLARARALNNSLAQAATLNSLASIALDEGRVEDSISLRKESLVLARDGFDPLHTGETFCGAARVLAELRQGKMAARLITCYEAMCEEMGASVPWVARLNAETLATIRTQLDEDAVAEAWEQGRTLTADEAVALALDALE
jgi:hypothetical protein